jgi:hypothetical protein
MTSNFVSGMMDKMIRGVEKDQPLNERLLVPLPVNRVSLKNK